jgi:hypothetical protein
MIRPTMLIPLLGGAQPYTALSICFPPWAKGNYHDDLISFVHPVNEAPIPTLEVRCPGSIFTALEILKEKGSKVNSLRRSFSRLAVTWSNRSNCFFAGSDN